MDRLILESGNIRVWQTQGNNEIIQRTDVTDGYKWVTISTIVI